MHHVITSEHVVQDEVVSSCSLPGTSDRCLPRARSCGTRMPPRVEGVSALEQQLLDSDRCVLSEDASAQLKAEEALS